MIENNYQLIYELTCEELYFLKGKEHLKGNKTKKIIKNKCGF